MRNLLSPFSRPLRHLRRFGRSARGSITIEAILVLPLWIWAYIATEQFFDAYRENAQNVRAAYTLADAVSRRLDAVGPDYIDGLHEVFDYITRAETDTWIRVTSVYWDSEDGRYRCLWSYATEGHAAQTDDTIALQAARLPRMVRGETVVVVETNMAYTPFFNVGLGQLWYRNFVPTRPRFASKVEYDANS